MIRGVVFGLVLTATAGHAAAAEALSEVYFLGELPVVLTASRIA